MHNCNIYDMRYMYNISSTYMYIHMYNVHIVCRYISHTVPSLIALLPLTSPVTPLSCLLFCGLATKRAAIKMCKTIGKKAKQGRQPKGGSVKGRGGRDK